MKAASSSSSLMARPKSSSENSSAEAADERVNLSSNIHAQQGIERYPVAPVSVASTGIHGVSSSAWFPMRKIPGLRNVSLLPVLVFEERSWVGSSACTFKDACEDSG